LGRGKGMGLKPQHSGHNGRINPELAPPVGFIAAAINNVDPPAWLADVLARINDHNIHKLDQLLPWNWNTAPATLAA